MRLIKSFQEILNDLDVFDSSLSLMMGKDEKNIMQDTKCLILEDENVEKEEKENKFKYLCGIHTLQDIKENLIEQKPNFLIQDILEAVNFYIENDSFIDLS